VVNVATNYVDDVVNIIMPSSSMNEAHSQRSEGSFGMP
jgi:hypothetical protein